MSEAIMKKAADELLKIADEIEKEAAEVTQFVCDKCNHTATLAAINEKRKMAAKEAGENVTVSDITVNDNIKCPACDGVMAYKATEASEAYYFDPDKKAGYDAKEEKEPEEEPAEKDEKEAKKENLNPPEGEPHDEGAPHDEKTETPEEEKAEKEKSKEASIDYDSLQRYTA